MSEKNPDERPSGDVTPADAAAAQAPAAAVSEQPPAVADVTVPARAKGAAPPAADPGWQALESRVGEARDRFEQLVRGRRTTRRVRSVVVLVILATFVGWVYATYRTVAAFDTSEFEKEMEARADTIWSRVSEMMFQVVTETRPAYAAAITRELEKAGPIIADRIDTEVKILEVNVQKGLQERLERVLSRAAKEQREELKKAFPDLASDTATLDRMTGTIQEGLTTWVSKELTTTLHEHVDALLEIKQTLASFRPGDPKATATPEDVLGIWLELVYERIGGDEALELTLPPDGPQPAKAAGPKKKGGAAAAPRTVARPTPGR
jgi:hypothetical protein